MNKQFCVFGNPIHHSLSPMMHNYAFDCLKNDLNFRGSYGRFLLQDSSKLAQTFFDLRLDGANITLPFKEEAFRQSDRVEGIAEKIQAVNTWVLRDKKIYGYNTDAMGFYETIKDFCFQNALILGAGGSAKAIAFILQEKGIEPTILNRSKDRIGDLEQHFDCYIPQTLKMKSYDLVINATASSLQNILPFDKNLIQEILKSAKYAYDLAYMQTTPFLELARQFAPVQNGKNMLIAQGVLAFEIFCNKSFPQLSALMQKALI
ncbi:MULTISPECIES: shikimate dehydrogenase [unclassified Helicobacter]|uniref:shikimate dehydrogenase n=1 Tax=unclassified Helicobacter TaxID=2593540 RepID=UPI000CF0CF85|nr:MULTISPECIES: shikimate dehydrogenase [unclassified Helicobacter]